jgi:hypothetical protein
MQAGHPAAADRLAAAAGPIGARGLEIALDRSPKMRGRYDEYQLRQLLRDTEILVERIGRSVASGDPSFVAAFADQIAPVYRRRRVPMDDMIALLEGLRSATPAVLAPNEQLLADQAIDAGIREFREYRKLAGDARPRNRILAAIYKGG